MQLHRADLRHRCETFDAIDLDIRFAVPPHRYEFEEVGSSRHGMALKKSFAADPVRRAHQRARSALQVADHPCADRLEIAGKVELGHGSAVTTIRPKLLIGL